ncbi:MAG TPA: hypothetical protein VFE84_03755 [Patescibacteria group bacterium]|nr:hypothetical protein [Patescibacteria group bacterium]
MNRATTSRARTFLIPLAVFVCAALATTGVRAESATLSIDRVTTLNFMRAATPFTFEIIAAGFTERFTLFNPRELRFEGGKVRLKVDCRGEPMSVNAELEPTLVVYFDHQKNAFVAKVQSLPVRMGALGTINLDQYIQPFVLPVSFSQTLDQGIPGLTIDYLIRDLRVLDEKIEAKADLVFRKQPPRPAASSGK